MSGEERIAEIRALHRECLPNTVCEVADLLARLDALASEASDVARENETLIEEVKASGEQIAALAAERDAADALYRESVSQRAAVLDERDALRTRAERAEAALRRSRLWLEGASETFSETMTCDGDNHEDCDSYCERYRDMERGIAEIDAALAAASEGE